VDPTEAWPALAGNADPEIGPPEVIARTSWTCRELLAAVEEADPAGPYRAVTLQVGVNDQYREHPDDRFAADFEDVLSRAAGLAGDPARVIVVSIPDWSATPHADDRDRKAVAAAVDRFNEIERRAADGFGCHWVDVTASSRRAAADPRLIAGDGLHPSAVMHRRWAEILIPVIREVLG
jgi:lysophospholipase L1-like esterase